MFKIIIFKVCLPLLSLSRERSLIQGRSSVHQGWSQQPSRWPRFSAPRFFRPSDFLGTRIFLDIIVWGGGLFFAQQLSKHPPALRCLLGSELWDLGHVLCVTGFFLASRGLLFRTRALVSGGAFRHGFSLVGPLCHGDSFLLAASWHQGQQLHSPGSNCLYAVAPTGLLDNMAGNRNNDREKTNRFRLGRL